MEKETQGDKSFRREGKIKSDWDNATCTSWFKLLAHLAVTFLTVKDTWCSVHPSMSYEWVPVRWFSLCPPASPRLITFWNSEPGDSIGIPGPCEAVCGQPDGFPQGYQSLFPFPFSFLHSVIHEVFVSTCSRWPLVIPASWYSCPPLVCGLDPVTHCSPENMAKMMWSHFRRQVLKVWFHLATRCFLLTSQCVPLKKSAGTWQETEGGFQPTMSEKLKPSQ